MGSLLIRLQLKSTKTIWNPRKCTLQRGEMEQRQNWNVVEKRNKEHAVETGGGNRKRKQGKRAKKRETKQKERRKRAGNVERRNNDGKEKQPAHETHYGQTYKMRKHKRAGNGAAKYGNAKDNTARNPPRLNIFTR